MKIPQLSIILRRTNHSLFNTTFMAILILGCCYGLSWGNSENLLQLPKTEGSKSFDLEIDQINTLGIKTYNQGKYKEAKSLFKKALRLSIQLRDPSQGILYFNLAITLHKLGRYQEATKQYNFARRLARGNQSIIRSEIFHSHIDD